MNCRECATFLDEYFDGTLEQTARVSFEFHLSRCRNCERYLESYRATLTLERVAFDDAADKRPDIPEDLVRAILDARASRTRRPD
jgi:predicted anti-sigma-YlaC factor YlaD